MTCRPDLSAFSESVKPLTEQYRVNRMLAPGAGRSMANSLYLNKKPKSDREHTRKRRRCLMGRKLFMSVWEGQRVCPDCKESRTWRDGECWLPGEHQNDR